MARFFERMAFGGFFLALAMLPGLVAAATAGFVWSDVALATAITKVAALGVMVAGLLLAVGIGGYELTRRP